MLCNVCYTFSNYYNKYRLIDATLNSWKPNMIVFVVVVVIVFVVTTYSDEVQTTTATATKIRQFSSGVKES